MSKDVVCCLIKRADRLLQNSIFLLLGGRDFVLAKRKD